MKCGEVGLPRSFMRQPYPAGVQAEQADNLYQRGTQARVKSTSRFNASAMVLRIESSRLRRRNCSVLVSLLGWLDTSSFSVGFNQRALL